MTSGMFQKATYPEVEACPALLKLANHENRKNCRDADLPLFPAPVDSYGTGELGFLPTIYEMLWKTARVLEEIKVPKR